MSKPSLARPSTIKPEPEGGVKTLLTALHLGWHHPTIALAPVVERGIRYPCLPADLSYRCAFLRLAQNEGDMCLRELRRLNGTLFAQYREHNRKIPV